MNQVVIMDWCGKVQKDVAVEAKACQEYFEWCDDVAKRHKNSRFEVKSAMSGMDCLQGKIGEFTGNMVHPM